MMIAPASGMNTAKMSPQWFRKSFTESLSLDREHEGEGQHRGRSEEERPVLLDLAGLDGAEQTAEAVGPEAAAVDGAIDRTLVDVLVRPVGAATGHDGDAVDDAVEHVLVEPVRGLGDRPLQTADHNARVEIVEVVLVDEERV